MAGEVFCFHSMRSHCFTKIAIFAMFLVPVLIDVFQKKKETRYLIYQLII